MAWTLPLLAIGIALALACYQYIILPAFLSPLSKLPTPQWSCSLSPRWFERRCRQQRQLETLRLSHEKYGPIVLISPDEVSVASTDGLRQIYTAGLDKNSWYVDFFANYDGTRNLVSMLDHPTHARQKRMITGVYAKSFIVHSADYAAASTLYVRDQFLPLVDRLTVSGESINVLQLANWIGADLVSAYLFGSENRLDFINDEASRTGYFGKELASRYYDNKPFCEEIIMDRCTSTLRDMKSGSTKGTQPVVFSRLYNQLSSPKSDAAVLDHDSIMKQCASEMLDHIVAGHETTGITMTYVFWQLSQDTKLQAQLRDELLSLKTPISHDSADFPPASDIDTLPLLHAVLFETLRRYTAAPNRQMRVVPRGGIYLHGYFLPEGTVVSCNAYTFHRHEGAYPQPLEWRPERWMPASGGKAEQNSELMRWFWAFGSGGRMCLGSNFAIAMLKLLIAAVYTNYTTSIVDDEGIEQADDFISGPVGHKLILKFHKVQA